MNNPEFPKARLIREDFLPEQDSLKNYRIKKVTKGDGEVWYYPQKKFLWFWIDISKEPYGNECWANGRILNDFKDSQKDKVEYLEPNLNSPEPKPLLKLKKTTWQMTEYPSYCCPNCGEQIGWLGRLFNFFIPNWHRCKND